MSTTYTQDIQFIKSVVSKDLLENSIEWIASNLNPEDVFSKDDLSDWAIENGYVLKTD